MNYLHITMFTGPCAMCGGRREMVEYYFTEYFRNLLKIHESVLVSMNFTMLSQAIVLVLGELLIEGFIDPELACPHIVSGANCSYKEIWLSSYNKTGFISDLGPLS